MKQMGSVQVRQVCCQEKKAQEPERTFLSDFAVRWMKMRLGLHLLYVKLMPVFPLQCFPFSKCCINLPGDPLMRGDHLLAFQFAFP